MSETQRIAIIGNGRWGKKIRQTLASIPNCDVVSVVTHDWGFLLEKGVVDGVVVATPAQHHAEVAMPFIERGIPVFIEKPMSILLTEAMRVELSARNFNSPVMVGHIHLFSPAFNAAKNLLPECGRIRFLVGEGGAISSYREGSSTLWEWAPHDLSMILSTLAEKPQSVSASAQAVLQPASIHWNSSQIVLNFKDSVRALVFSSCLLPERRRRLTIVGENKTIVYDDTLAEGKVAVYQGVKSLGQVPTAVFHPKYDRISALELEMLEFLKIVRTRSRSVSDEKLGATIVKIIDGAESSIAAGGKVVEFQW